MYVGVWVLIPYFLLNIMKCSSPAFSRNKRQKISQYTWIANQWALNKTALTKPAVAYFNSIWFFWDEDNVGRVEEIEILSVHVLYN